MNAKENRVVLNVDYDAWKCQKLLWTLKAD